MATSKMNQRVCDRINGWDIPDWVRQIINDTDFNSMHDMFGSFETAEALVDYVEENCGHWYAVMVDDEDNDWGVGSYDLNDALSLARSMDAEYIAVIEMGNDPICVDEIRDFGAVECMG